MTFSAAGGAIVPDAFGVRPEGQALGESGRGTVLCTVQAQYPPQIVVSRAGVGIHTPHDMAVLSAFATAGPNPHSGLPGPLGVAAGV